VKKLKKAESAAIHYFRNQIKTCEGCVPLQKRRANWFCPDHEALIFSMIQVLLRV
jgi:hypothetical protein